MPRRRQRPRPPADLPPIEPVESTLEITRLAYGGQGVGHLDGLAVFVPRTLPGDVVAGRLIQRRKRYAVAEILALREASPLRVPAPCSLYDRCGGCHLQHLGYDDQLANKTQQVRDCLTRIGKLPDIPVLPTLASPQPFGYRNKALYHYDAAGNALGLIERGQSAVLDVPQCRIGDARIDAVMARVRNLAGREPALRRVLHQVQVQMGQRTGEVLITVIVRGEMPTQARHQLWESLRDVASGLLMHRKATTTAAVFDGVTTHLGGSAVIREHIGDLRFQIEPEAFFQVNSAQTEQLYGLVRAAARLQPDDVVLDLYSGGGAIALTLAPHCAVVHAVESNRQATLLAARQAIELGIANCEFRTGKVERILYRYLAQGVRAHVAVLDPPRAGCRPQALEALAKMRVPRLVYVSCSPPTLARDLRLLNDLGYRADSVQPLDMFPQTYHVECLATLSRVVSPGPNEV
jgi:23S rRNA (uracil1939-C5)-methyltransferase